MSVSLNDRPNKVTVSGDAVTVTTGSGIQGAQGATGATGAGGTVAFFGNFFSTETQTNADVAAANTFTLNSTVDANGVSIVDGSKITFAAGSDGTFDLQFSAQFDKTDSGTDEVDIWISKNGTDLEWSNTVLSLVGNNAKAVPAWNFQLNDVVGGDYFELHWWSPDSAMRVLAVAAGSSPTRPAVPSLILTVAQVTYTQEGGTSTLTTKGDLLTRDASTVARLPVGATTGHVLTVDPAEATGMKWAASSGGIPETLIDAKGDLIVGSAADTAARLAVGANGQGIVVRSGATLGVEYGAAYPIGVRAVSSVYYNSMGYFGTTNGLIALDLLVATPFWVGRECQFDQIAVVCSTGAGSSNIRMGIYADNGGVPGALIVDAGTVSTTVVGTKAAAINVTLSGMVWVAAVTQGANASFARVSAAVGIGGASNPYVAGPSGSFSIGSVSGTLPDPWSGTTGTSIGHHIYLRKA